MKVRIKDLVANPFRDIKNYSIDLKKVESLAKSITETGFWDNILARKRDSRIEIAYGHHRLQAMKQVFKPEDMVNIPVRILDDAMMIKIMANENDEQWAITPGIVHETVRVTKEFLFSSRGLNFIKTKNPKAKVDFFHSKEAFQIAEFLGGNWNEYRVALALRRLDSFEKGELDKEAVESLPTEQVARDFTAAVKMVKPSKKVQRIVAEKIVKSRAKESTEEGIIHGRYRIETELFSAEHEDEEKVRKAKAKADREVRRLQFEKALTRVTAKIVSLDEELEMLLEYQDYLVSDHYQKSKKGQNFTLAMADLFNTFQILMSPKKTVDLVESFKLLVSEKEKE